MIRAIIKRIKMVRDYTYDIGVDIQDRMFMLTSGIALFALFIATLTGFFIGENLSSIALTGGGFLVFFTVTALSIKFRKYRVGAAIVSIILIFVIAPVTFITSDGINGGAPVWIVFMTIYTSLVLSGKMRNIFLVLEGVVVVICYQLALYWPEIFVKHSDEVAFLDSISSVFMVSIILTVLIAFEIHLFRHETKIYRKQKAEIEELDQAQTRFFSNMSHEIRTPINAIIGMNEMILREDISEEVAEDATNIRTASKMLLNLINDILDMSKFEAGQMELANVNYDVGNLLSEVVGMMWVKAKEKNLEFRVDVARDIPAELYGDEVRIRQVLINVISNAIKYTASGSVKLSVQCERMKEGMARIVYTVTDTGMGIKKESIPYLFDAYKRVDKERNRYIEGTGLGLSIVKQIVDLMGGNITVNSIYTQGSTFIIEIPQQIIDDRNIGKFDIEDLHRKKEREKYTSSFTAPKASILVVDDNSTNLLVVKKLLRDTGISIDTVMSGEEALKKTLEKKYHVILMDHMMPGMDGIECMHMIKKQMGGLNRESRIVVLTANAEAEKRVIYEKEGFNGYLVKPVKADVLETELLKQLPDDLVTKKEHVDYEEESEIWLNIGRKRTPVLITAESVADIPEDLVERHQIPVIPYVIKTEKGEFKDDVDMNSDGLLNYVSMSGETISERSPSVKEYERFFAEQLSHANNVIHISTSDNDGVNSSRNASEAARAFDNVRVFESGHISGSMGILVLEASRMADEGRSADEIIQKLNELKNEVNSSFIADNLDYPCMMGVIGMRTVNILKALMIRPMLIFNNGKLGIKKFYRGSQRKVWKNYIKDILKPKRSYGDKTLFICYTGLSQDELKFVTDEVNRYALFRKIYYKKASPAVGVNGGPGTFGLLFLE